MQPIHGGGKAGEVSIYYQTSYGFVLRQPPGSNAQRPGRETSGLRPVSSFEPNVNLGNVVGAAPGGEVTQSL